MELGNWKSGTKTFPEAQMFALLGLASGMSDKEIARERGISRDGVNNTLRRIREKWGISKRSQLVSEAIARGIIVYCAMFLVFISGTLSIINDSFDQPRTNARISTRTTRNSRLRGRLRTSRHDLIDFDLEDAAADSMVAMFESQTRNTLAPWSSSAWMRNLISQQDLVEGSSSNELRMQLWRNKKQILDKAQTEALAFGMTEKVLAEPSIGQAA